MCRHSDLGIWSSFSTIPLLIHFHLELSLVRIHPTISFQLSCDFFHDSNELLTVISFSSRIDLNYCFTSRSTKILEPREARPTRFLTLVTFNSDFPISTHFSSILSLRLIRFTPMLFLITIFIIFIDFLNRLLNFQFRIH